MSATNRARAVASDSWRAVTIASTLAGTTAYSGARSAAGRRGVTKGFAAGTVNGMERLGPTFVKLGQLIASSPGLFPADLSDACRRCLDHVPPVPASVIRAAIEADLGAPISELFPDFDDQPLSAASIAQVHACTLPDGRPAVVKVQRPGIAPAMLSDLRILRAAARIANRTQRLATANPIGIVDDLHRSTINELDLTLEAARHTQFRNTLQTFGDNHNVTAPEIYPSHCGQRTICMERMSGTPIDRINPDHHDGQALLTSAMKAWMESACVHGPFHGDIHAGNLWVLDDGRICFLDFGITGELDDGWKRLIASFLLAIGGNAEWFEVAAAFKAVGAIPTDAGSDQQVGVILASLIDPIANQELGTISFGEVLKTALTLFASLGAVVPAELVLVIKQLLYFERYAKQLAPGWQAAKDPSLTINLATPRPTI